MLKLRITYKFVSGGLESNILTSSNAAFPVVSALSTIRTIFWPSPLSTEYSSGGCHVESQGIKTRGFLSWIWNREGVYVARRFHLEIRPCHYLHWCKRYPDSAGSYYLSFEISRVTLGFLDLACLLGRLIRVRYNCGVPLHLKKSLLTTCSKKGGNHANGEDERIKTATLQSSLEGRRVRCSAIRQMTTKIIKQNGAVFSVWRLGNLSLLHSGGEKPILFVDVSLGFSYHRCYRRLKPSVTDIIRLWRFHHWHETGPNPAGPLKIVVRRWDRAEVRLCCHFTAAPISMLPARKSEGLSIGGSPNNINIARHIRDERLLDCDIIGLI